MLIYAVLILAIGISGIFTADTKNVNDDYDGGIDRDGFYNPYSSLQGKDTYLDPYVYILLIVPKSFQLTHSEVTLLLLATLQKFYTLGSPLKFSYLLKVSY